MDMSEYRGEFVNEAREHLQILNQSLLDLEHDRSNMDLLNNIFRAAHTLKGSSATMGYTDVNTLTHRMENVLDAIRNGEIEATSEGLDTLFGCFDALEIMIDAIDTEEQYDVDVSELVSHLDGLLTGGEEKNESEESQKPLADDRIVVFSEEEKEKAGEAVDRGLPAFKLKIRLEETCALKSVRAVMILKTIGEHAEILSTTPDAEKIEDGAFDSEFDVIIGTNEDGGAIRRSIEQINEVAQVDVLPLESESEKKTGESKSVEPEKPGTPKKKPEVVRSVQSVRVNIEKLDSFVNMVGELVINKIRLLQIQSTHQIKELDETISNIDRLTNDLRDEVMQMRMVAVDQIFNRFPRMVRDLAKKKNKNIELIIEGNEIELDRTVLDEVGEPLIHLLRNCVDHGIEAPEEREKKGKPGTGVIKLIAQREKNHVKIEVADDGAGIDPAKIRAKSVEKGILKKEEADALSDENALSLIFTPGFSTAETITDVSGRGVGMDVVKTSIEALGGSVNLRSEIGVGTTVTMQLPLTMAIIQALLVEVANSVYAVPISSVLETISVPVGSIRTMGQQHLTTLRGNVLPLVWVHDIFGIHAENGHEDVTAVVVDRGGQHIGLVVDSLVGQQEIAIKSLNGMLAGIKGFAGATILGDGRVIMILDVASLV